MVRSQSLDSYSSVQDVTYSCGYCGYALNLSSSARDTATIGYSKYGKQIRKGVVAFHAVDEARFTLADEVTCAPHFRPGRAWSWSWGLFRRRSRLLCRKCGARIGVAYQQQDDGEDSAGLSACSGGSDDDLRTNSADSGASRRRSYVIRIGALQPSSDDFTAVPFSL
ncbi:uncharacterized protein At4g08330, chloroplastic-like [Lolium rigidum]|uniref:uncharacterized protein At4g08330, chloroplastic-like n=1 Tax=Lolium rigidum TaxID=89674 RepID=UPI001F5D117B|nr:uncharacterized protein At4g08330, chloroplastic-like [Lolium rigidum]